MNIEYPKLTPRLICEGVSKLSSADIKLTKRPWDRFRPDNNAWWLVPSTDLLHYKYAKLYFNWNDEKQETVNCGLYIEKGLDESLAPVYSSKQASHLIMNKNWSWHRIVNTFNDMNLFEAISRVGNNFPIVKIIIDGGYVTEPTSFDPYQNKKIKWDKYCFLFDKNLKKIVLESSKRYSFTLKLHSIKTIQDLTSEINELNKNQWLWLNLFICIGTPSKIDKSIADSIKEIYENSLRYLVPLLK